ncbi:hypothetical protein DFJ73DRAFT_769179 [Zopfochytrium polystomum]|nr:hypothetical protein DFJ73DRAFT_769179 [Zopfochytrium polystomum]
MATGSLLAPNVPTRSSAAAAAAVAAARAAAASRAAAAPAAVLKSTPSTTFRSAAVRNDSSISKKHLLHTAARNAPLKHPHIDPQHGPAHNPASRLVAAESSAPTHHPVESPALRTERSNCPNIDESQADRDFCRDFVCCGLALAELQDLLQHIQDAHYCKTGVPRPTEDVSSEDAAVAVADAASTAAAEVAAIVMDSLASLSTPSASAALDTSNKSFLNSIIEAAGESGKEEPVAPAVQPKRMPMAPSSSEQEARAESSYDAEYEIRDILPSGAHLDEFSAVGAPPMDLDMATLSLSKDLSFAESAEFSGIPMDLIEALDLQRFMNPPVTAVSLADIYRDKSIAPASPADSNSCSPAAWSGDSVSDSNDLELGSERHLGSVLASTVASASLKSRRVRPASIIQGGSLVDSSSRPAKKARTGSNSTPAENEESRSPLRKAKPPRQVTRAPNAALEFATSNALQSVLLGQSDPSSTAVDEFLAPKIEFTGSSTTASPAAALKRAIPNRKLTLGERAFLQSEAKISRARTRALAAASEVAAAAHAGLSLVDQVMMRLPKVAEGEPPRRLQLGWLAITDPTTVGLEIPSDAALDASAAAGIGENHGQGPSGPTVASFIGEKKYICPCCHRYYRNANGLKYHLRHTHGDGTELLKLGLYFGAAGRAAAARATVASAGRVAVTARGGMPLEPELLAFAAEFESQEIAARKAAAAALGYDEDAIEDDGPGLRELDDPDAKPFPCLAVYGCGKRYKSLNGLRYHFEHAHGEELARIRAAAAAGATRPPPPLPPKVETATDAPTPSVSAVDPFLTKPNVNAPNGLLATPRTVA